MAHVTKEQQEETLKELEQELKQACRLYLREQATGDQIIQDVVALRILAEEYLRWLIL